MEEEKREKVNLETGNESNDDATKNKSGKCEKVNEKIIDRGK